MKLRRVPEDFQVEELTEFRTTGGPFALYRLTKRSLGTPEAVDAIARRWNLARRDIGYGGLKDRHAETRQYLTIARGPQRGISQEHFFLEYLGQARRPFSAADIAGNRFQITLRHLTADEVDRAVTAAEVVKKYGVPNYFDDQRFGSVPPSGEFMALAWCRGDYERALWLALAEPNVHDRPDERLNKERLRQHWGDWQRCKDELTRSHARSIVTFLTQHPQDFRRAVALIRQDLRSLYLSAFQSYLWNRLLASRLRELGPAGQLFDVALELGPVPFHRELDSASLESLREETIPLPSARLHLDDGPLKQRIEGSLAELGLSLRELRVKYPRDSFFSRNNRHAIVIPRTLKASAEDDAIYPGQRALTLEFDLPRGSYATILIKRLTSGADVQPG